MKSISAINPVVTKNTECLIVKEHAPVINQNSGFYRSIMVYHYALFLAT